MFRQDLGESKMNNLIILGRHFARDSGISIRLEKNAVPSANIENRLIILPSNLAEGQDAVVLTWLLHECGHLQWSQPMGRCIDNIFFRPFLNTLEDIRVDRKIFRRYEASKDYLFRKGAEHARDSQNGWKDFRRPAKILVSIILKAEGYGDLAPDDEEVKEFFTAHGKEAMDIARKAASARSTFEVTPLARRLARLIIPDMFQKQEKDLNEFTQIRRKKENLSGEIVDLDKRRKSLSRKIRYRRKRMKKLPDTEQERGKKNQYAKELGEFEKEKKKSDERRNGLVARFNAVNKRLREAEEKAKEAGKDIAKEVGEVPGLHEVDENGLEYVQTPSLSRDFDRILLEKLREKKARATVGNTLINPRKLYKTPTQPWNIFGAKRNIAAKWKNFGFLLDGSGSMAGEEEKLVCSVMLEMAKALERVSKNCLARNHLHYGIWAFNHVTWQIKGQEEKFKEDMLKGYRTRGGTDLASGIETVAQHLEKRKSNSSRNIIFCMTDALVSREDVRFVRRFRKAKLIFLGIGAQVSWWSSLEDRKTYRQLFLKHNLQSKDELETILKKVVLQEL